MGNVRGDTEVRGILSFGAQAACAAGLIILLGAAHAAGAVEEMTSAAFLAGYKNSVADRDSTYFVRLTAEAVTRQFESLLDAALAGDDTAAGAAIDELGVAGVSYRLVSLNDTAEPILGFMETAVPGDPDYRGWGAVLVRPASAGRVVYQAPHVKADLYSEEITFRAFLDNPLSRAVVLAGAHRAAVGDGDGDGAPDSDVANDTENLFHALTGYLARRGLARGEPLWFIQFHGAADRDTDPSVVGSDGSGIASLPAGSPLVGINNVVDEAGHVTMGVCGWREGAGDDEDGVYALNASNNLQGAMLSTLGQRHSFMHFEIERTARDEWHAGVGSGYDGIGDLMGAITAALFGTGPSSPPSLPARINFQPAVSGVSPGFLTNTGSPFRFMDGPACGW
jgi:hypothetical protein